MNRYVVSTVSAGILWGVISVFLKPLSAMGFSPLQILSFRAIISAFFMLIFLLAKDRSLLKISVKDIWMFLGTGVFSLTFFSLCYFQTILENGASVAVILLYTSPIFILLMSVVIFKEKITVKKIIALVLTFLGCILVAGISDGGTHISAKGFFIGICAGFGYALYSIFSRFALKKYDSLTVTFYTFVFSGVSSVWFSKPLDALHFVSAKSALLLCGIAIFCTVLPYILYTFGLSGLENSKAAILVTVEPLIGTLTGVFLWKEEMTILKAVGILMIFASIIILSIKPAENNAETNL